MDETRVMNGVVYMTKSRGPRTEPWGTPQSRLCTTLDPTRGSGRVGSENLQETAGRVGLGPVRPEAKI